MRRFSPLLVVFLSVASLPAIAAPDERLVMSFACAVENGRVVVTPSAEKIYPIMGQREEQAVTACRAPLAGGCRTLMAHRFAINCGGFRVPWADVAAAVRRFGSTRLWLEAGRLNVALAARRPARQPQPCGGVERQLLLWVKAAVGDGATDDCLPWRARQEFHQVAMPPGFAPVGEVGARLLLPEAGVAGWRGGGADGIEHAARTSVEPAVEVARVAAVDLELAADDPWKASVIPANTLNLGVSPSLMWLIFGVGVLGSFMWLGHQYPSPMLRAAAGNPRLAPIFGWLALLKGLNATQPVINLDADLGSAAATVRAMLEKTEAIVCNLKTAGPLRDVLTAELGQLRQRLSVASMTAADGGVAERRVAPTLRTLVREIERVRRIADSAAVSITRSREDLAMPRTKSEAYAVLGVNPDVSDGVLKKIVDGLRASWHPDHAKDDADRTLRESRIKQINIAWELTNGKRRPA